MNNIYYYFLRKIAEVYLLKSQSLIKPVIKQPDSRRSEINLFKTVRNEGGARVGFVDSFFYFFGI